MLSPATFELAADCIEFPLHGLEIFKMLFDLFIEILEGEEELVDEYDARLELSEELGEDMREEGDEEAED